jgi:hypothetical protein
MNAPGVYLIHLAVLRVLGSGDAAWRAFDLAWLAATSGALSLFVAPFGRVAAAAAALLFAVYHLAGGAWQAGQRDFLMTPLLVLAALGVARWVETGSAPRSRGLTTLAAGGLAAGAAVSVKPHALVFAAALALLVAVRGGARRPLAVWLAGLALVPAAVVGWVAWLGGLPDWVAIVREYLVPLYSGLGEPGRWHVHRWPVWVALVPGVAASLAWSATRGPLGIRHLLGLTGLGYGLLHYVGQGKGWEYHLYPLAAFACLLLVAELDAIVRHPRHVLAASLVASLVAVTIVLGIRGAEAGDAAWIRDKERTVGRLAADLAARLAPGDRVQVLDTTGGGLHALLRLGVRQPTRFIYDFHFFHDLDHPTIRALRAELVTALEAAPPRLIVLFVDGWPAGGVERVRTFPALAERLARAYEEVARRDAYVVYAQRDRP